jgi:hypothetical protein
MAISVFWTCCKDRCGLLQNKHSFTQIILPVLSVLALQGLLCVTLVSPIVWALHCSTYTKMLSMSKYGHQGYLKFSRSKQQMFPLIKTWLLSMKCQKIYLQQ